MSNIEKKIFDWISDHFWIVVVALALIGGLVVRKPGMYFHSDDYESYLYPWFMHFRENGGFRGLKDCPATYYIPYLVILAIGSYFPKLDAMTALTYIKVLSIILEFLTAFAAGWLAYILLKDKKDSPGWAPVACMALTLSPMVVLNGAYWGQCDYYYVFFLVMAYCFLNKEKYDLAFIMVGAAFAFKLQALFLLPALLLYYMSNKKFSIAKFLWIPLVYIIGGLPAVLAGKGLKATYWDIYMGQVNYFPQLSLNMPNVYRFFPLTEVEDFGKFGIVWSLAVFAILGVWILNHKYSLSRQAMLYVSLISVGICVMFLPYMHERYGVVWVTLAYVYYLVYNRKKLVLPLALDLITTTTYILYLYGSDIKSLYQLFAVINIGILFYMIKDAMDVIRTTQEAA